MRLTGICFALLFAVFTAVNCGSSSPATPGPDGGGSGGMTGTTFKEVLPCKTEAGYMSGTMIEFTNAMYTPRCLKVAKGATVTFKAASGMSFADHPLSASKKLGDKPNPIPDVSTGETKDVTFPDAGIFAYFCKTHGFSDSGADIQMNGAIWVQ